MGTGKIKGSSRNESEASSILQPQYANKLPGWMMTSIHKQLNTWRKAIKVSATLKIAIFPHLRFQHFQIDMLESFLSKKKSEENIISVERYRW